MVKRKYSVLQVADLNRGAFGFVQLAKDLETGEQVAIKFIERGDKVRATSPPAGLHLHCTTTTQELVRNPQISKYVEREIMNHKQLRHPHIVELREVRNTSQVPLLPSLNKTSHGGWLEGQPRLTLLAMAGVSDARVPGHCDGVRDRWGHVSAGRAAAGFAGEGRALVLPAAHYRSGLLPQNGALLGADSSHEPLP